jgi:bifunctional pyridoxal-dependent enzyme with beta-cystathionase and maltose regulon repressor activities
MTAVQIEQCFTNPASVVLEKGNKFGVGEKSLVRVGQAARLPHEASGAASTPS